MEATEPPEMALKYYDELLEADSANGVSRLRSGLLPISTLRSRFGKEEYQSSVEWGKLISLFKSYRSSSIRSTLTSRDG
jgi:hypothetical protein